MRRIVFCLLLPPLAASSQPYAPSEVLTAAQLNASFAAKTNITDLAGTGLSQGANLVGYQSGYAGAAARTLAQKAGDVVSVLDFAGCDPTGASYSTSCMQAAHNTGLLIYYPPGRYKFTTLTIPGGGILGAGQYTTTLITTDTSSSDIITYTGTLGGTFREFNIYGQAGKSGGAAINVNSSSVDVSGMRFFHLVCNQFPTCIHFTTGALWSIASSNFYNFFVNGLLVDNRVNGDSGDSVVSDSQFESVPYSTSNGIQQVSAGGLKIVGSKFNNLGIGYLLNLAALVGTPSTSDLMIVGNSFENCANSAVQFQRQNGSTSLYRGIVITGNQILVSSASGTAIYSSDSSNFLTNVNIGHNDIFVAGTKNAAGVILDYISGFLIDGLTAQGSGGANTVGIRIGTHTTNGKVGINEIKGFGHSTNLPASVSWVRHDVQTGTLNVTTGSAYVGSLYQGSATITFAKGFEADVAPTFADVSVSVTGTTGGGVGVLVTNVSATQLNVIVIGATNGGSVPIQWTVRGLL